MNGVQRKEKFQIISRMPRQEQSVFEEEAFLEDAVVRCQGLVFTGAHVVMVRCSDRKIVFSTDMNHPQGTTLPKDAEIHSQKESVFI